MSAIVAIESQVTNKFNFSLAEEWIKYLQVKETSIRAYMKGVKNFFGYCAENNIALPNRETVLLYRQSLATKYAPATRNLYLSAVKAFLDFLKSKNYLAVDTNRIKGYKTSKRHSKKALTADKNGKIIANFDTSTVLGKRNKAIYSLMSVAGLRTIEVVRANVGSLDENDDGRYYLELHGKGHDSADEVVEVPAPVFKLIQDYLAAREDIFDSDSPLFASLSNRNFGGRMTTTSISRLIKSIFRANEIDSPKVTAHSLRHTAATVQLLSGATLRQVQQCLRHTSINVTTRYLHELDRAENHAESLAAAAYGLM